ncbi:VOC family protein [soil metagenome]
MGIDKLGHYSVRTTDVATSRDFYVEILGLRVGTRPDFPFPGAWLYLGDDETDFGVVHIVGIDPENSGGLGDYLGDRDATTLKGSGAVDHMAFLATDWASLRNRCDTAGIVYSKRVVPALGLLQIFLTDPSGVTIELNFPAEEASR